MRRPRASRVSLASNRSRASSPRAVSRASSEGFSDEQTQGNQGSFSGGSESTGQSSGGFDQERGTGTTANEGFGTDSDTMTQQSSRQDSMNQQGSGQSGQESGFIGSQGSGSDEYVEEGEQSDLADRDSLTQENDQGMGSSSSEEESF
jgi:hypothetical protein